MIERTSLVQIEKLATCRAIDGPEPDYEPVLEQRFGIRRTKGLDHTERVLREA